MKVYLAHGHRNREDGKTLEQVLTAWGHEVYNPFDGDSQATKLTQAWKASDDEKRRRLCTPIYHKDLKHIRAADALVAYYPTESTGTAQEIQIARSLGKATIVLTDLIHPFIQGHIQHVLPPTPTGLTRLRRLLKR